MRIRRSTGAEMEEDRPPIEDEDSSDEEDDKVVFGAKPLTECARQYFI